MSPTVHDLLICSLAEFLEAAVHSALFTRQLYQGELFEKQRLYGIFVQKARHPGLCGYISDVITNLKPLLASDTLQELDLVFYNEHDRPVEKVVFLLRGLAAPAANADIEALEAGFRSALLKLQFADNLVQPLPAGCRFELLALATSRQHVNVQQFTEESPQEARLTQPAIAVPVKTVHVQDLLNLQVLIEEAEDAK